ncbi:hypothetical protein [Streptomyces sp. NPDC087300]|uniref:hypothetical protein n=1 Tax=Streptomyces sp. NPDC087300 TaxID=3365780 RepID=UPI003806AB95
MGFDRRTTMKAGLGAVAAAAVTGAGPERAAARGRENGPVPTGTRGRGSGAVLTVQAEAAVRTNLPVVADRRAAKGKYVYLLSSQRPPAEGWFATYVVDAPEPGTYELTAVATAPVEVPHTETVASYLHIAVNDEPPREVSRSQPYWYESRAAWET